MSKSKQGIALGLFGLIVIIVLVLALSAGTGRMINAVPHYVNLNLYYNYTPANLDVMKNAFQEASRLLFNSTNGQLYIGSVRVSTNSAFQNKADVWINSGASGAFSNVGGLGTSGMHFTLFEDRHRWTAEDGPGHNELGQFGIIHEFGHYAFDLGDEYQGPGDPPGWRHPGYNCVNNTSTEGCIMDGGTTEHPYHHRTEWCTVAGGGLTTAHQTTPVTRQEDMHACSCWETIVNYCNSQYGIALTVPAAVQTADPAGLPGLDWIKLGDNLRMAITLDRSYSMTVDDKMTLAKQAAVLFTDLCQDDSSEYLGVVSFSNTAVSDFPMQSVTAAAHTRANAVVAVNGIAVENMTALGDGLRRSFNEITGGGTVSPSDSANEVIILLSDGVHNYGTETPAAVLPDLRNRGVQVFSIGLGDPTDPTYPLDENTLRDISDQTGGMYMHATSATQLATIYTDYAAEIRGMDSYPEVSGELSREGSGEHKILVDRYTKEQTFILHWPYGVGAFELLLRKPDGTILTPKNYGSRFFSRSHHAFYRILSPEAGTWTMIVKANPKAKWAAKPYRYTVQSIAKSPGLSCKVAPRQRFYKTGQAVVLRSAVFAMGVPVAKAEVTGFVIMPNGEKTSVKLVDNGDRKNSGDEIADDGIYTAKFFSTRLPGTYKISIVIRNTKGVTAKPDEYDPKWKPAQIAPFTRTAANTFQVERISVKAPLTEKKQ